MSDIEVTLEIDNSDFDAELEINGNVISYDEVINRPKINGVLLVGDKTTEDLGIKVPKPMDIEDVDAIFDGV